MQAEVLKSFTFYDYSKADPSPAQVIESRARSLKKGNGVQFREPEQEKCRTRASCLFSRARKLAIQKSEKAANSLKALHTVS